MSVLGGLGEWGDFGENGEMSGSITPTERGVGRGATSGRGEIGARRPHTPSSRQFRRECAVTRRARAARARLSTSSNNACHLQTSPAPGSAASRSQHGKQAQGCLFSLNYNTEQTRTGR